MTLGHKLSKLRKENNYTQEQLADVLGVSRQAISKWESDVAYPETDKLIRICKLFNCTTDYLLLEENDFAGIRNQNSSACECLPDNQLLMNELQKYVDTLFSYQRKNAKTENLKEKLLSKMIKEVNDLILQGMTGVEALEKAMEGLGSEEWLTGGNQLTDMQEYTVQCSYSVLLNCTLFWIFTLPLLFVKYTPICFIGLIATFVSGIFYIMKSRNYKKTETLALISILESRRRRKIVWVLWGVFFSIFIFAKAAVLFGSNLWFRRPVEISGPYAFANLVLQFYVPLLTIFIPITVGSFTNLLSKYEKRYDNEKEK